MDQRVPLLVIRQPLRLKIANITNSEIFEIRGLRHLSSLTRFETHEPAEKLLVLNYLFTGDYCFQTQCLSRVHEKIVHYLFLNGKFITSCETLFTS